VAVSSGCVRLLLNKSGHHVTIIDQGELKDGCSFGNAGMIVPSHFVPFAAPGMISKGIRWMFNPKSPFMYDPDLAETFEVGLFVLSKFDERTC